MPEISILALEINTADEKIALFFIFYSDRDRKYLVGKMIPTLTASSHYQSKHLSIAVPFCGFCYKTSNENGWEIKFCSFPRHDIYESSPELEHITPAPSLPAQLSFPFPRWGHSSREDSYPRQRTSSIANVLETGPNWDFVVGCPEAYPSILTNIWFFQGKVRQTCKLQLHCRRHVHRHRRAGHPRRCFLHGVQILPTTSPLSIVWRKSTTHPPPTRNAAICIWFCLAPKAPAVVFSTNVVLDTLAVVVTVALFVRARLATSAEFPVLHCSSSKDHMSYIKGMQWTRYNILNDLWLQWW